MHAKYVQKEPPNEKYFKRIPYEKIVYKTTPNGKICPQNALAD